MKITKNTDSSKNNCKGYGFNFNYYRGEDHMKKFCKNLREHAAKIINYEKKKNYNINNRRRNIS